MTLREKIQNILFDYGVSYKNEEATRRIMEAVEDNQADYRIRMVPGSGSSPARYQAYDKSGQPYGPQSSDASVVINEAIRALEPENKEGSA